MTGCVAAGWASKLMKVSGLLMVQAQLRRNSGATQAQSKHLSPHHLPACPPALATYTTSCITSAEAQLECYQSWDFYGRDPWEDRAVV